MTHCISDVMAELFAKRLKQWRGGLRQKEAAAILDIPLPTYRKYEAGKRTPGKLALIVLEQRLNQHANHSGNTTRTVRLAFLPPTDAGKAQQIRQEEIRGGAPHLGSKSRFFPAKMRQIKGR